MIPQSRSVPIRGLPALVDTARHGQSDSMSEDDHGSERGVEYPGLPGSSRGSVTPTKTKPSSHPVDRHVVIPVDGLKLPGLLSVPVRKQGTVIFAHSSDSDRRSPRNLSIARSLQSIGLSTLLFDLLAPEEAGHRRTSLDIELIGTRLLAATEWVRRLDDVGWSPCGLFGTGTGGAGALWAAAAGAVDIGAVVSRGGCLDLIGNRLPLVRCPTLFIVGADDADILPAHRRAASHLQCPYQMATVPGSTPSFEEAGVLGTVARLACQWFDEFLLDRKDDATPCRRYGGRDDGPDGVGPIRATMAESGRTRRSRP